MNIDSGSTDLIFADEALIWADPKKVRLFQEKILRQNLSRVANQHPVYSKIIRENNLDISSIATFSDLNRIFPITTKESFLSNPTDFVLSPDSLNPKDYLVWDVTYTAGTSGQPAPVYQTTFDFKALLFAQKRMAGLRGMTASDKIFNLYPLAPYPHGGWIRPSQAAAVIGASAVVGMSGSTSSVFPIIRRFEEVVDLVASSNPSVLWGVPSYVLKILRELERRNLKVPELRLINVSGEPCGPSLRRNLQESAASITNNQVYISDSLGATELQFSLVECPNGTSFHNPVPEIAHVSVIDEDGQEVEDGQTGKLQVTHLNRRGTVLIKYLLGDLAKMDFNPCQSCGWTGGSITKHLGREGKFLKVRGQMVNSKLITDWLDNAELILDYKISISNEASSGLDKISVDVATKDGSLTREEHKSLVESLSEIAGLRVEVSEKPFKSIWIPEDGMKPKRLEDLRVDN
jgi:phenylacetate-coenzyme A ligase PaaK-like adenylate-forming protein